MLFDAGAHGLTIEAVARHAAISKPSIYYYFRDRQELLEAIVLATLDAEIDACLQAVQPTTSGADAAVASLRALVQFYTDDPGAARIMFGHVQAIGMRGEPSDQNAIPRINAVFDLVADRIAADQRAGKINRRVHPRRHAVLARMLGTGIAWTWALLPRTGTSSKHSLRDLVDDAEQSLRARLRR